MAHAKMKIRFLPALLLVLAALLTTSVASAAVGKIDGVVTDKDGNPLADVVVTVASADGSASKTARTNKRGKFNMTIKEPGKTYSVRLEKTGYDSYEGPIEVTEGQTLGAEFKLLSAEEGEAQRAQLEAIESKNKSSRLYNEGVELYNAGDTEGALQKFAEAFEESQELVVALAAVGRIHLEAGRFDESIESLARFEEIDPGRLAVLVLLHDAYDGAAKEAMALVKSEAASAEEKAAAEQKADEMAAKANATLESLVAGHPGPEAATRVFNQGVAAVGANELERARERFSLVLELAPELHPAHVNLAHIHRAFEDWEAALSEVDLFLAHEPEHVRALTLRYEALEQLGRDGETAEALAKLRSVSPGEAAGIFHEQGVRLFNANEREAAMNSFRRALEIDPVHSHSHYMLGLCLAGQGELGEAVSLLEKFLELDPENPDAAAAQAMLDSLR